MTNARLPRQGTKDTVFLAYAFGVEIDHLVHAVFSEVSGLEAKMEVEEYKEGGLNGFTWKFPGRVSFTNVTLKWGTQYSSALWDWYETFVKSERKERRSVDIIQFDASHVEKRRWTLERAFPVKWSGPAFNSANTQIPVESIELAFEDLVFVKS
ncbi:MAG: phage tail protein [Dehalococcoidia bacterium]